MAARNQFKLHDERDENCLELPGEKPGDSPHHNAEKPSFCIPFRE